MAKLDPKLLRKLLPLTDEVQRLARLGPDNLEEMGNLVTAELSKYESLIDITDEEVDLYLNALVFEEV
tara:strand:- start:1415 stop:1618 length:204 start_codon:yes stop_codon:yes gene_type:complete